jgi:purine-cytosine permease-like protein
MNALKKYLGIVWMLLGPIGIVYLVRTALSEIAKKPVLDTKVQWAVFIGIFIPIAMGMVLFGWYAFRGEYDRIPTHRPRSMQRNS